MSILFKNKEAFERVKRYLETNQYSFETQITKDGFLLKVTEWG